MSCSFSVETVYQADVVETILAKRPEEALEKLSSHYGIDKPELRVGAVKGRSTGVLGVYVARQRTIYVRDSEVLYDPFVIIHEFYHHLRTRLRTHRGTEKYADRFADGFIRSYLTVKGKQR
jgi:hypothetical protein